MGTKIYLRKGFVILIISLVILPIGCAITIKTRPNTRVLSRVPALNTKLPPLSTKLQPTAKQELPLQVQALFQRLYDIDPYVALEVGRLPEFQGQVGELQVLSLSRFTDFLANASPVEKANLGKFLKVGQPAFRRYCSPLQAVFWLLEKEEYNPKESPLIYSLNTLLRKSWKFSEEGRWGDYETVTDRLNAPELIDYYEWKRFKYYVIDGKERPYHLFKTNLGHCRDVSAFTVYCLQKGGYYRARELRVASPSGLYPDHAVTLFEVDGKKFIMDNGRPDKVGIVPFEQYNVRTGNPVFPR